MLPVPGGKSARGRRTEALTPVTEVCVAGQSLWRLLMTIARNLCVAVIYTDLRGSGRYGTTREASKESGTPPGRVPLNMGVGVGVWE